MKVRKPLPRSTHRIPRTGVKRKPRPKAKTLRIYGPPARRVLVKAMPCAACGIEGFSVQAHLAPSGEKGTGYKASAKWIAPLCCTRENDWAVIMGCHEMYDEHYEMFTELYPNFDAVKACAETELAWLAHLEGK